MFQHKAGLARFSALFTLSVNVREIFGTERIIAHPAMMQISFCSFVV